MEIKLGLDSVSMGVHYKDWDGLSYLITIVSPNKKGTQEILNNLVNNDKNLEVKLIQNIEEEVIEVYLNGIYISDVVKSKYKRISKVIEMNYEYHIDANYETLKNGDIKLIPSLYYVI